MYNLVITLIQCFILEKSKRHMFKDKYKMPKGLELKFFKYLTIFIFNYIKYLFKQKVSIQSLELWVGTTCTMHCKHCSHLIPYVKPELSDIQTVINNTKILLDNCNIEYLNVLGGEPFTHPEIAKLLKFIATDKRINKGRLITNGTIMPNEEAIKYMKEFSQKEYSVCLDIYESRESISKKFCKIIQDNNIPFFINWTPEKNQKWLIVGDNNQNETSEKFAGAIYDTCPVRNCSSLYNSELTSCPRGITSASVYNIKKFPFENINISKLKKNAFSRAIIATCLNDKIYKEFCKYCLGFDTNLNHNYVPAGEQLTRENEYAK